MPAKALPEGKLPIDVLKPMLESIARGNLVVPPGIGVDVGVTKSRGKYLVSSSDPITGTSRRMGWHAVNVSANDVSTSGIMPETLNVVALFPNKTKAKQIRRVMDEINKTANDLGITVAGGHTEITPGLDRPILIVTAFGTGDRFVTAADARANDTILMTKSAGIEGTSILARLPGVKRLIPPKISRNGERLISRLSVVREAKSAFKTGKVHAMHDVTEGGILGAVLEMSLASNLGFVLDTAAIPVDASTRAICNKLSLDPLRLIGSGSLLIACSKKDESSVIRAVRVETIACTPIGRFVQRGQTVIVDGKASELKESSIQDELWPALRKYGNFS